MTTPIIKQSDEFLLRNIQAAQRELDEAESIYQKLNDKASKAHEAARRAYNHVDSCKSRLNTAKKKLAEQLDINHGHV